MAILVRWGTLFGRVLLSAGAVYLFWRYDNNIESTVVISTSGVIVGLAATLLGFLITAVSLLTALTDKTLIHNMIKTGHFRNLMSDTMLTCLLLILLIVFCLLTLLSQKEDIFMVFLVVIFLTTLSFLYLIEAGRRFSSIVTKLK